MNAVKDITWRPAKLKVQPSCLPGAVIEGRTLWMHLNGFAFYSEESLPAGSKIKAHILFGNTVLVIDGIIAGCTLSGEMGFRIEVSITNSDSSDRLYLKRRSRS